MVKARHVLLAASVLCVPFASIPAWSQGGGAVGGGGLGTSSDAPDPRALDKINELVKNQRPDGSMNLGEGEHIDYQYANGARLQNGAMGGDDYEIDYPNCSTPANVSVKPPVKECLADRSQGSAGVFYEVQYIEFTCPDLTPPFRRLALKFKKLGPCKPADYDTSKQKAETYGESWTPTDQVTFNDTGDGGQKTAQGGGQDAADPNAMPEGWSIRTVAFFDNDIEIIWEYKDGNQFMAIYRRDGTSNWTYKGDKPEYPTATPPRKPKSFHGRSLEIETAKASDDKAPDNKPNKAADSSQPGKTESGKTGGNTPGSNTGANNAFAQPGSDKPKAAAAPSGQPNPEAGFVRVMGPGGKWFWITSTGTGVVSFDPNDKTSGPQIPLGGSEAGWKPFTGADGKTYWVLPGTTMLPADAPSQPSGWMRVQGTDGKWFWLLPTDRSVIVVDPNQKASGPTTPLGGAEAGWKQFRGTDGKTYWVLSGTTMLPTDAPSETKSATTPKKDKSAKKKSNGKVVRSYDPASDGPNAADVATAVGTGLAIGTAVGGMREGRGSMGGSMAPASSRMSTGSGMTVRRNTVARPSAGSSGQTINTTVGRPTIRMQGGMGFGF